MLGHFEKQVAVYTNLKEKPFYLTLSGSVAQTGCTSLMVNGSLESLKILNVALPGACQRSVPNSWRTLSKRTCAETLAVADKGSVAQTLNSGKTDLPYRVGDLYLETDNVEFDDVYRGDNPVKEIRVYNSGRQSITPQLMHLPKYLKVVSEPEVIRPGRSGRLYLTLNSELLRNYW